MMLNRKPAYIGIDVAFAKRKRLPVCVCTWQNGRLVPEAVRRLSLEPPRGKGNRAAFDEEAVGAFVDAAAEYVEAVCDALQLEPRRIALDAPSAPRPDRLSRRAAEVALDGAGISCFTTPSVSQLDEIRERVERHLADGGAENRMPHANQLWMMVGFALFRRLERLAPCIEVFPQATVRALGAGDVHKFRTGGVDAQLRAVSRHTGWPEGDGAEPSFREIAFGPAHDRLDAYLSAWVAALDEHDRMAFGDAPDDVIWIPDVRTAQFEPGRVGSSGDTEGQPRKARRAKPRPRQVHKAETETDHRRPCPACGEHQFKRWPFGWDAHAAHTCGGLFALGPDARKREFKRRFGHLFGGGGRR